MVITHAVREVVPRSRRVPGSVLEECWLGQWVQGTETLHPGFHGDCGADSEGRHS